MSYLTLIVVTLIIGFGAQAYVNSRLKKYEKVPATNGQTGAEVAQRMLAYHGITNVQVRQGRHGEDHFDPRTNSISLGPESYSGRSITAAATACHEVGHACQYAFGYTPMKIRSALVPVVNIASNAWMFIFFIGLILNIMQLVDLAIIFYACAVLFQIVTLPVEFDASKRAMTYMETIAMPQGELMGSSSVLRACAFTYVAAALTSILQLLWLLGQRD